MGTVTSAAQVAAKMTQVGVAVQGAQAKAVRAAAAELKSSILAVSPARMRNVGKRGAALGVSFAFTGGDTPIATGKGTGPWPLIEYPTPTHLIGIGRSNWKRARVRVVGGAAQGGYLKGANYAHGVRGPVVHPGTKGKMLFHKGTAAGTPKAVAILRNATVSAVAKVFG